MTNKVITEKYGEGLLNIEETVSSYTRLTTNEFSSMYGEPSNHSIKKPKPLHDQVTLSASSSNSYLIEIHGQKIHVPTMVAYQSLIDKYASLKADYARLFQESRRLFGVVKKLTSAVNEIDEELAQKVDKYDTDTGI